MRKVERARYAVSWTKIFAMALMAAVAGSGLVAASDASAAPFLCEKKGKFKIRAVCKEGKETAVVDLNPTPTFFEVDSIVGTVNTVAPFQYCGLSRVFGFSEAEAGQQYRCELDQNEDGTWDLTAAGNIVCSMACYGLPSNGF